MRRTAARSRGALGLAIAGALVLIAAMLGTAVHQAASSTASLLDESSSASPIPPPGLNPEGDLPDGVTVYDDEYAGIAGLDPALRQALSDVADAAAAAGIELHVTSGWRSREYQDRLLQEAVLEYGSEDEAARWVATPETSVHVTGDAVDIGPFETALWLSEHGPEYGLCQIYLNEPWHFELRQEASVVGCPSMFADPTHDPRMQL